MRLMKIALISHTTLYWTPLYGRYLSSRGHDVRIVSFSKEHLDGLTVQTVGPGTPGRVKALRYLARVPQVRALIRALDPDVVLATYLSSNGLAAALSRRGALVVSAHGTDVVGEDGAAGWARGRLIRFVCGRATAVHAVSNELAARLAKYGVPRDAIECFPIGVDTGTFTLGDTPRHPGARPAIVCTRRHEPVYDNGTIVEALALVRDEFPDVRGVFLGGGPLLDERLEQVRRLGLEANVELPGHVSPSTIRTALREADVYVSASSRDGASSSLLEAMSCGSFPVVSRIPANLDWVSDGETGLLFSPGDPVDLARALRTAFRSPALREAAREANRRTVVDNADLTANMRRMESLLERAARDHAAGPLRDERSGRPRSEAR